MRSRMLGALAASATVHALVLLALAVAGRFAWPAAPIPIEMVAPRPHAAPHRAPPPPKPQPPPSHAVAARDKVGLPMKKVHQAAPSPPPQTSDLKQLAPDDANLVLLLRSDKLRASPHRDNVERLLSGLPDYDTLLGGTGLTAIGDLDALLIATNDPRSITATFLAARYPDSPRLRAILGRSLMAGDPRVFRTLQPGLTVLTQPEGAAQLDGAQHADGGTDPRVEWLRQLEQLARGDGPALLVTIADVPSLMRFGGGLPTPLALALAMTGDASPSLRLKAVFASPGEARQFVAAWPEIVQRWRSATVFLGLGAALDGLSIAQHDVEAEVTGRLPEAQVKLALSFATTLLPRHDADGGTR